MQETLNMIADFIGKVGFPVFVCCYLLFRFDRKMDKIVVLLQNGYNTKKKK